MKYAIYVLVAVAVVVVFDGGNGMLLSVSDLCAFCVFAVIVPVIFVRYVRCTMQPVVAQCPACRTVFRTPESNVGIPGTCGWCGEYVTLRLHWRYLLYRATLVGSLVVGGFVLLGDISTVFGLIPAAAIAVLIIAFAPGRPLRAMRIVYTAYLFLIFCLLAVFSDAPRTILIGLPEANQSITRYVSPPPPPPMRATKPPRIITDF